MSRMASKKPVPTIAEQEHLLQRTREELRAEQILQMRPDVQPWRKGIASQHEMSLRAEIKLRLKALAYYRRLVASE
jgi:hypothetical protein